MECGHALWPEPALLNSNRFVVAIPGGEAQPLGSKPDSDGYEYPPRVSVPTVKWFGVDPAGASAAIPTGIRFECGRAWVQLP